MTQRIIVLGAERSGTSVVAEMIHRWGAFAGSSDKLPPPDEHNPHGRWEYMPLWDLLTEIGGFKTGISWWDADFDDRVAAKVDDALIRQRAAALIADMGRGPWVWKDPALCHFLPFWTAVWGDVSYVICVRHPADVARSWQQMAAPGVPELLRCNLLRWQHMMLSVLAQTESAKRKLFVSYEALMRQPLKQARRLQRFLDGAPSSVSDPTVQKMAEAVDPDLWRNRCERSLASFDEATPAQLALYDFLLTKVSDPNAPMLSDYPMPDLWRSYVRMSEAAAKTFRDSRATS